MMRNCDKKYTGGKLEGFWNNINFDKATSMKSEEVRDYLLWHIKDKLGIDQNTKIWSNGHVCLY